jgi:hypothetical protein
MLIGLLQKFHSIRGSCMQSLEPHVIAGKIELSPNYGASSLNPVLSQWTFLGETV